ncbi:hypothetical protein [Gordonia sihwensis]|uniref:hypothetical protein n=1 Tax=Gordonia sihwensis TaxID=173559 RepID=UPI003D981D91
MTERRAPAVAADRHALIVAKDRVIRPSGAYITDGVDSIGRLLEVVLWCFQNNQLGAAGLPAQVWILREAGESVGWDPDQIDLGEEDDPVDGVIERLDKATDELLDPYLAYDGQDGWHLFRAGGADRGESGWRIQLSYQDGKSRYMVDFLLEGWASLTSRASHDRLSILGSESAGTLLDFEDDMDTGRELARRLIVHVDALGVLPGNTPARTGAALADKIWRPRRKNARDIHKKGGSKSPGPYPRGACPVPPIPGADAELIEPPIAWSREIRNDDLFDERHGNPDHWKLVTIDQRASYLASAGMLNLGLGELVQYRDDQAEILALGEKIPFGIWRVRLPALSTLHVPDELPPPHPAMRQNHAVEAWVTTESIKSLSAPPEAGGAGARILDLEIAECWVTQDQGMALKTWKERLAAARKEAQQAGDRAIYVAINDIYRGYLGRIQNGSLWKGALEHHYQPLWAASIRAHARHRNRAKAMKVSAEHGLWPIKGVTDSWSYLVPDGVSLEDDLDYLGKFQIDSDTLLNEEQLLELLSTETAGQVSKVIFAIEHPEVHTDDAEEEEG